MAEASLCALFKMRLLALPSARQTCSFDWQKPLPSTCPLYPSLRPRQPDLSAAGPLSLGSSLVILDIKIGGISKYADDNDRRHLVISCKTYVEDYQATWVTRTMVSTMLVEHLEDL